MKKLLMVFSVFFACLGANAQYADGTNDQNLSQLKKNKAKEERKEEWSKLNLTQEQKLQMKTENENFRSQMKSLKSQNLPETDFKSKKKSLEIQHKQTLNSILTPTQKVELKEMHKEHNMENGKGDKQMEMMIDNLGLSDEQKQNIEQNRMATTQKMESIKNDSSMSDDQKKEQFRQLKMQEKNYLMSQLTPEQKQKAKDLIQQHQNKMNADKMQQ